MREVGILKKDPETLREQIDKLEMMSKFYPVVYVSYFECQNVDPFCFLIGNYFFYYQNVNPFH